MKKFLGVVLVLVVAAGAAAALMYSRVNQPYRGYTQTEQFVEIPQGTGIATSTRLSAGKGSDIWMRVMMLAPSASTMSVTMLGDVDLTQMRGFFVKPKAVSAMSFSDDPMLGMSCDRFAGSATTTLETTSLVLRTASLR